MAIGINHGGVCPQGRRSEAGPIPERYALTEHSSEKYPPRTAQNVCDADATMVLLAGTHVSRGTKLTCKIARDRKRPWCAFNMSTPNAVDKAVDWLRQVDPEVLNVAGPRETSSPGIQRTTADFVSMVMRRFREK
jgi:hypothetical protein